MDSSEQFENSASQLTQEVVDYGWEQSAEIGDIMTAFAAAQSNFTDPPKDTKGQYGMHASMAGVYSATRKHLNKEGIAVIVAKSAQHDVGLVGVSVRLYKGAQFIGVHASTPIKADRQSYIWAQASGWTYLERYLTSGLTGVAPDDDDDGATVAKEANPDQREVQQATKAKKAEQQTWAEPRPAAGQGNDRTAQSGFLGSAAAINPKWNLTACRALLQGMYGHSVISKLNKEQIEAALENCRKGDPDEVLAGIEEPAQ